MIRIERKPLIDAMKVVCTQVPLRPTHPVLGTVLFKFGSGVVELTGFDLSALATAKVDYSLVDGDSLATNFCLDAPSVFYKLLDTLDCDFIKLEHLVDNHLVVLHASGNSYQFHVADPDEYPDTEMNAKDAKYVIELNGNFADSFKTVSRSITEDPTKQVLTGLNIALHKNNIVRLNGTDGHRLTWAKTKADELIIDKEFNDPNIEFDDSYDEETQEKVNPDIPLHILTLVPTVLKEAVAIGTSFKLYLDESVFNIDVFSGSGDTKKQLPYSFAGRLLDGAYPHVDQLIPRQFTHDFTINLSRLIESLDRMALLNAKENIVVFDYNQSLANKISVKSSANSERQSEEIIPVVEEFADEQFTIAFSLKYMSDILKGFKALGTKEVKFNLGQHNANAVVIEPIGSTFEVKSLIMPVRISS